MGGAVVPVGEVCSKQKGSVGEVRWAGAGDGMVLAASRALAGSNVTCAACVSPVC